MPPHRLHPARASQHLQQLQQPHRQSPKGSAAWKARTQARRAMVCAARWPAGPCLGPKGRDADRSTLAPRATLPERAACPPATDRLRWSSWLTTFVVDMFVEQGHCGTGPGPPSSPAGAARSSSTAIAGRATCPPSRRQPPLDPHCCATVHDLRLHFHRGLTPAEVITYSDTLVKQGHCGTGP